jgi:hypothetical protein
MAAYSTFMYHVSCTYIYLQVDSRRAGRWLSTRRSPAARSWAAWRPSPAGYLSTSRCAAPCLKFFCYILSVLWIHDILVLIRINEFGSEKLENYIGTSWFGFGSGSMSFKHGSSTLMLGIVSVLITLLVCCVRCQLLALWTFPAYRPMGTAILSCPTGNQCLSVVVQKIMAY